MSITSDLLWRAALVTALIDAPLVFLAARLVSPELFRGLKWYLVGAALLVYAGLWGSLGSLTYWEAVYSAIFPPWLRWLLPGYGLIFGAVALGFWRLCLFAAHWPAAWFSVMGGLVSRVGHSIGISRGLMRVPMLAGASAESALVFGVFEFIFYWCGIVALAAAARWVGLRLRSRPG